MSENEIREPIQKRSIEKKEKIIKAGFDLICQKGYYNTNTAEIAKFAGVSTGIVYQYFRDKHDILIAGIEKYACDIFYPMLKVQMRDMNQSKNDCVTGFKEFNLEETLKRMINYFLENHKLSQSAHEEIMAMTHSDSEVAKLFKNYEIHMTNKISDLLVQSGYGSKNMPEKVHIAMHLIDDLCHEIVYHKHETLDYDIMTELTIKNIINLMN